jgi:antitoxin component of RelBE/YafQ-DinJ toxin-antitoxin module
MMGFRAAPVLRASIVKWAENQPDIPTLSEATRRLVELGLTVKSAVRSTAKAAVRAAELAAGAIDKHADASAPSAEREARKNRLLRGPSGFRDVRKDSAK